MNDTFTDIDHRNMTGSSGNILADRRYAYAEACMAEGDFAAAADLFAQAIEIAPGWAAARVARGFALERAGDLSGAHIAFSEAVAHDPADLLGAGLHRDRLRGMSPPGMPPAYVAALFDQYAPRFDTHLLDGLGYRGPQVIVDALAGMGPVAAGLPALDLGCGTGLMARALTRLGLPCDGIDLSGAMIIHAEATGLYRHLWRGDCATTAHTLPAESYGLVVAADVLVYVGELGALFAETARVLVRGGLFAATVQAGDTEEEYALGDDLRYRHSETYLRNQLAAAGLAVLRLAPCVTRRERGADVPGLVFVARRP